MDTYGWCFSMGLLLDTVQATLGHIIIGPMFDPVITALVLWYWTNGMRCIIVEAELYECGHMVLTYHMSWCWQTWPWYVTTMVMTSRLIKWDNSKLVGGWAINPQKHLRQLGLIIAAPVDTNTSISMIRVYYIYIEIVYSINIYITYITIINYIFM